MVSRKVFVILQVCKNIDTLTMLEKYSNRRAVQWLDKHETAGKNVHLSKLIVIWTNILFDFKPEQK